MSDRNRGPIFAFVTVVFLVAVVVLYTALVWTAGSEHSRVSKQQQANSAQYAATAEKEIEDTCLDLEPVAKAECIRRIIESTNEHDRSERDLVAQSNMALWALGMLIVSAGALILTAFGVFFIWRTLMATQATLREAEMTTSLSRRSLITTRASAKLQLQEARASNRAVRDANRIALDNSVAERRPWIRIGLTVKENGIWVNADGFGVSYVPNIENVGNSPAFDVKMGNLLLLPIGADKALGVVDDLRTKIRSRDAAPGYPERGITVWPHSRAPFNQGGMGRGDSETAARVATALEPRHSRNLTCIMLVGVSYKFGDQEAFTSTAFRIDFDVPDDAAGKHVSDNVRIRQPKLVQEEGRFAVAE